MLALPQQKLSNEFLFQEIQNLKKQTSFLKENLEKYGLIENYSQDYEGLKNKIHHIQSDNSKSLFVLNRFFTAKQWLEQYKKVELYKEDYIKFAHFVSRNYLGEVGEPAFKIGNLSVEDRKRYGLFQGNGTNIYRQEDNFILENCFKILFGDAKDITKNPNQLKPIPKIYERQIEITSNDSKLEEDVDFIIKCSPRLQIKVFEKNRQNQTNLRKRLSVSYLQKKASNSQKIKYGIIVIQDYYYDSEKKITKVILVEGKREKLIYETDKHFSIENKFLYSEISSLIVDICSIHKTSNPTQSPSLLYKALFLVENSQKTKHYSYTNYERQILNNCETFEGHELYWLERELKDYSLCSFEFIFIGGFYQITEQFELLLYAKFKNNKCLKYVYKTDETPQKTSENSENDPNNWDKVEQYIDREYNLLLSQQSKSDRLSNN